MRKEVVAAIVLVAIIIGAVLAYFYLPLQGQQETAIVEVGDCVDINYIGRYASNGTIFDTSYFDVENKTDGTPLNVFVSFDPLENPPEGYEQYYAGMIEGFMEGLIGLEKGKNATITILPEKGYGNKAQVGDSFNTIQLMMNGVDPVQSLNITVEITSLTSEMIDLKWINPEDFDTFTMPEGIINDLNSEDQNDWITYLPPHAIWQNATTIVEITNDSVIAKTTPTSTENVTDEIRPFQYDTITSFIFPDATTVSYDDDTITITHNPVVGDSYEYGINYYGEIIITTVTIESVDTENETINVSTVYEGFDIDPIYQNINKTVTFDRSYTLPREFKNIPSYFAGLLFQDDLAQVGLSLHELAGETLIFDIDVVEVYKTSQN